MRYKLGQKVFYAGTSDGLNYEFATVAERWGVIIALAPSPQPYFHYTVDFVNYGDQLRCRDEALVDEAEGRLLEALWSL